MSDTRRPILSDLLVDDLATAKFRNIQATKRRLDGHVCDASSEALKHSDISRNNVTTKECKTIRSLDHHRCFVTNAYSHTSKIGYILDNCNAGNTKLVSMLAQSAVET
jgi:hypothetical protein